VVRKERRGNKMAAATGQVGEVRNSHVNKRLPPSGRDGSARRMGKSVGLAEGFPLGDHVATSLDDDVRSR